MSEETYYRTDFEEEFNSIHSNTISQCKEKGESDGRRNLPLIETSFLTPFENGIINKYQSFIESIASKGGQFLQELFDNHVSPKNKELERLENNPSYIQDKLEEENRELQRRLEQAREAHQDKLKVIENEPSWLEAKLKFDVAKKRFEEVTTKIQRKELHISLPKWIYLLLIFAMIYSSTSRPAERALPAIVLTAASISAAVKSGIFVVAISSSWALVTLPTLLVFGVPLPFLMPAALRNSTEAGGVFLMNVKLLSL